MRESGVMLTDRVWPSHSCAIIANARFGPREGPSASSGSSTTMYVLAVVAGVAPMFWKWPPWLVVLGCAAVGWLVLGG